MPGLEDVGRAARRAFLEKFGEELPVDVASVHAVGAPLDDGGVVACGVAVDDLSTLDPGTLSLATADIPSFVNIADGQRVAEELNFLVGNWEPQTLEKGKGAPARLRRGHRRAVRRSCPLGFARRAAPPPSPCTPSPPTKPPASSVRSGPGATIKSSPPR